MILLTRFWKLYAWVISTLYSLSLFWSDWHSLWEVSRIGIDIMCLLGLISFAYHRPVGTRTLWRVVLCLNIATEVWTFFMGLTPIGWELWFSIGIVAPLYYGLIVYAFGSNATWPPSRRSARENGISVH